MTFDDRVYTQDALIKQLGLVELHGKDGSAVDSGCACIETKHTFNIEGLAEEGIGFSLSEKEKRFYQGVADWARVVRKNIETETFELPKPNNPKRLTVCERKRERCIQKLKPKEERGEIESAYAVCHASIPCP